MRSVAVRSIPRVRVSIPFVKYWMPLMFANPLAARIACVTLSSNVALSRMRWSMRIWNTSSVSVTLSFGLNANPPLRFTEVSSRSGLEPNTRAAGASTGAVSTSVGTPPMTLVDTWLKCDCASPGARKPVLPAARTSTRGEGWKRNATLPVTSEPKSE